MIIFIEGPRTSGKTHLIDSFFKQNTNPNVMYYKFKFAKYIDDLGMRDQDSGPGVHYFSIANVMTILELNETVFKDKIIVFDRSIYSAYVWSIYRERMEKWRLLTEFERLLTSDLYHDCALVYLTRKEMPAPEKRGKDYFDNFENYEAERAIFEEVLTRFSKQSEEPSRNNRSLTFKNNFDEASVESFCNLINGLANRV